MTQSAPTMPATQPEPVGYPQWYSPEGAYGPNDGWSWESAQALIPVLPADRLTLFQTFFSPRGRIGRQSYWLATLAGVVVFFVGMFAAISLPGDIGGILFGVLYAAYLSSSSMVLAKRWHDRNYSGWMVLVQFIPFVGGFWTLIECCTKGTPGVNRYGGGTNPTPFG